MSQTPVEHAPPDKSDTPVDLTKAEHLDFRTGTPVWVQAVKWGLLALGVLVLFLIAQRLVEAGYWPFVVVVAFIATCFIAVYATRRAIPLKYLLPGLLLLLALQIWPIVYTITLSFTNYGDGHLGTKEEAIASIEANSVRQVEGSARYSLQIAVPEGEDPLTGEMVYLLTDPAGAYFAGTMTELTPLDAGTVTANESGRVTDAPGYTELNASQVNSRSAELAEFAVPTPDGQGIKATTLSQAFIGAPTRVYDAAADTITDQGTGQVYVPQGRQLRAAGRRRPGPAAGLAGERRVRELHPCADQ